MLQNCIENKNLEKYITLYYFKKIAVSASLKIVAKLITIVVVSKVANFSNWRC